MIPKQTPYKRVFAFLSVLILITSCKSQAEQNTPTDNEIDTSKQLANETKGQGYEDSVGSVLDFVIPKVPMTRLLKYSNGDMRRIINYERNEDDGAYMVTTRNELNGFGNETFEVYSSNKHDLKMHVQVLNDKKWSSEDGVLKISLPLLNNLGEKSTKWEYKDANGDLLKCKSYVESVDFKEEKRLALIVETRVFSNGKFEEWASTKEYYLKNVGLWKVFGLNGEERIVSEESNGHKPEPESVSLERAILSEFSKRMKLRMNSNQFAIGGAYTLMQEAFPKKSHFEIMEALETFGESEAIYNAFFYQLYKKVGGNGESLRLNLQGLCDSYKLAGKVAEYTELNFKERLANERKAV